MRSRAVLVIGHAVIVSLGCRSEPPATADESSTSSGTTESGPSSSTGDNSTTTVDPPDIADWVGDYHVVPLLLTLGMEFSLPDVMAMGFTNLEIRADMTASLVSDACREDEPLQRDYRLEFVDADTLAIFEMPENPGLTDAVLRKMPDCGGLAYEATRTADGSKITGGYDPGRLCWIARCEPLDNGTYRVHADYCEGAPPPETPCWPDE